MKNAMQLKAIIKNLAKEKHISAQLVMQKQWDNYQKDFEYATDIAFVDTCDTVVKLMDLLIDVTEDV